MSNYLIQAAYSTTAIASMVKNPQDRAAVVRATIEKAGGKLHGFWLALGEYDVVAIAEMPDDVGATALSMAIGGSGAMRAYKTTTLLGADEIMRAMKQASDISFRPPQ